MKTSKQQDSRALTMQQAKSIKKRGKQKDKLPVVQKKMSIPPLIVLFDSLEAYDQVLSFSLKGMLYLCTVIDLHSALKVNGFQSHKISKEYIEKNSSVLNQVLFQTRFSSLVSGEIVITAMSLDNSEVEEDLAALQWWDGASKALVMSSPEVMTNMGEMQTDCSSEMAINCLADDPAESATANSSFRTLKPADIVPVSSYHNKGTTDMLELSADDCYRPDMSMVEMQYFCQAPSSPSMYMPDPSHTWSPQEEIFINLSSISEREVEPLIQPTLPVFCLKEQLRQAPAPVSSFNYNGSASQESSEPEEQVVYPSSSISQISIAIVEISDARAKLESEDVIEKFAPFICQTPESPSSVICSLPFTSGEVLSIPDQSHGALPYQAKNPMDIPVFGPETEQLAEPSVLVSDFEEVSEIEEHSSHSSVPSAGFGEEPAQPSPPLSKFDHTVIASQENCTVAKSQSEENFDLIEKFAREALQLNVLQHNCLEGLSNLEMLHETASVRSLPVMTNFVDDYIRLEEDQSSNSCQIQEMQHSSPQSVMPSPQQDASAGASSTSFVGLLAQVSVGNSGTLEHSICDFEEPYPMYTVEEKTCAKRLFIADKTEGSVEGKIISLQDC